MREYSLVEISSIYMFSILPNNLEGLISDICMYVGLWNNSKMTSHDFLFPHYNLFNLNPKAWAWIERVAIGMIFKT